MKDKEGNLIYNNDKKIQAALDMLTEDYGKTGNVRGDYADYTGLSQTDLATKLNNYATMYRSNDNRPFGGDVRVLDDGIDRSGGKKDDNPMANTPLVGKTIQANRILPTGNIELDLTTNKAKAFEKKMEEEGKKGFWRSKFADVYDLFEDSPYFNSPTKTFLQVAKTILLPFVSTKMIKATFASSDASKEDQKQILGILKGATKKFVEESRWSKDLIDRYNEGDEEAINTMYEDVTNHLKDISNTNSTYPLAADQTLEETFGIKRKEDVQAIANDLSKNIQKLTVRDLSTGEEITDEDEKAKIATRLQEGKELSPTGVLPRMSDLTLINGKYDDRMSQSYVVSDNQSNKKEYLIERVWEPNNQNSKVGEHFHKNKLQEKYLIDLPYEMEVPILMSNADGVLGTGDGSKPIYLGFYKRSSGNNEKLIRIPELGVEFDLGIEPRIGNYIIPPDENMFKAKAEILKNFNSKD